MKSFLTNKVAINLYVLSLLGEDFIGCDVLSCLIITNKTRWISYEEL